jgi:titin
MFSFLGLGKKQQSHNSQPSRCKGARPRLEPLEDRFLPSVFTVMNTNDSGSGSLRDAINMVNSDPNPATDTIDFQIGSGTQTISPLSALPTLTHGVIIDGTSQPGFAGTPLIELDGTNAGSAASGLTIDAGNSTVQGLVINRFGQEGILLESAGSDIIQGNYLGTDVAGTSALANGDNGVEVNNISGNTIGGTTSSARNLLSGNVLGGIYITGASASNNIVEGNFIGTDATGTLSVANGSGVRIDGATNNTIGGTQASAANVVSGNAGNGVVFLNVSTFNTVEGNLLGTDPTGTVAVANALSGVQIGDFGSNNTIGGTAAGSRNIISGNAFTGVDIISAADDNVVEGNYIGTDISGKLALGNRQIGVQFAGNAERNTVGGTTPEARNIISANHVEGIDLCGGASSSVVEGNYIGTDVTGTVALGNTTYGIDVAQVFSATITNNVISGNGSDGIFIRPSSSSTVVQANFIGTDASGANALRNSGSGIRGFGDSSTTIGGTSTGQGNVISGNGVDGIRLDGDSSALVEGNDIGTNAARTGALGNLGSGIHVIDAASATTIGGTVTGAGNLISGNLQNGVWLENASSALVEGNLIGTDISGSVALGNATNGVEIDSSLNTIGGTVSSARNIISGNGSNGLLITSGSGTSNTVEGNYIGTDVSGTLALRNASAGVEIDSAHNTIGGTSSGARNIISGNGTNGVLITSNNASTNTVEGNYIGTDVSGTLALANVSNGVKFAASANNNTIGGSASGAANTIAFNGADGVLVDSGVSNLISENSIFSSGNLGIELNTANNANNSQAAPSLSTADLRKGSLIIRGTLVGTANTSFTLEFFDNPTCDPNGFGEGKTFLASTAVSIGNSGKVTFKVTLTTTVAVGDVITATATDSSNDTSEFSNCQTVEGKTSVTPAASALLGPQSWLINNGLGGVLNDRTAVRLSQNIDITGPSMSTVSSGLARIEAITGTAHQTRSGIPANPSSSQSGVLNLGVGVGPAQPSQTWGQGLLPIWQPSLADSGVGGVDRGS